MADYINHQVYIPKFTTTEVADVTFGGFLVDQYIASQPNATSANGAADVAHDGAIGTVPGLSRPGVAVWDYITFPKSMIAAANKGKGWHLVSPFEWGAMSYLSKKLGTFPHGNNKNVNPPCDITYTSEVGILDTQLNGVTPTYYRALTGTGPNTWAHNFLDGVFDLNGIVWEWQLMMMQQTTGYPYIPANLNVTYTGSPYGRGTISGSGGAAPTLTCDGAGTNWLKAWATDEFNTDCYCYIAEVGSETGALYTITDTTATTIVLTNGDAPGDGTATFSIFKLVSTNITSGCTSGQYVASCRNTDADLKPFAIPATTNAAAQPTFPGGYYYDTADLYAAIRGGYFRYELNAGAFALALSNAPSLSSYYIGFRAAKTI